VLLPQVLLLLLFFFFRFCLDLLHSPSRGLCVEMNLNNTMIPINFERLELNSQMKNRMYTNLCFLFNGCYKKGLSECVPCHRLLTREDRNAPHRYEPHNFTPHSFVPLGSIPHRSSPHGSAPHISVLHSCVPHSYAPHRSVRYSYALYVSKLIGFLWFRELTAPYINGALGFLTKSLEELTLSCKLNWPHSAPEGSFNLPSLKKTFLSFYFFF
jgi:hypothetical protein